MLIKPNTIFTNRQNVILPLQAAKVCLNPGIANNIFASIMFTGKNNRSPFLDILGYLKNAHKNPNLEE